MGDKSCWRMLGCHPSNQSVDTLPSKAVHEQAVPCLPVVVTPSPGQLRRKDGEVD